MATTTTLPTRDALPREERWDIESLFATDAAWEAAYDALSARLPELATFEGTLGISGETLLAALRLRDELMTQAARVIVYASLRRAEDATNPTYAALASRVQGLSARANGIAAYYGPEILATGPRHARPLRRRDAGAGYLRALFRQTGADARARTLRRGGGVAR